MKEYTRSLAAFAAETTYSMLPAALLPVMKRCLLDTLGCAIAGSDKPEIKQFIKGMTENEDAGPGVVWGSGMHTPLDAAVIINGAMNHTVELDDLHKPSKVHPGAVIVPTVLTVGAARGLCGQTALLAMTLGYETMIRMGMALGTDSHRRRGWHATATCGSFGAAAAAGALLHLDREPMANALGLAGTITGGLMAYTADGSMSKRLHAGKAAQNGWQAAKLAAAGFTGPTYVLEAPDGGYAHAASDQYDLDILLDGLGQTYHAADVGLKYYACCGHIHQALDAVIKLCARHRLTASMIQSVQVSTYDVAGLKWGFTKPPRNTVEAQFSFPYAVSVAIIDGQAFLPQFSQARLCDPEVLDLAARVEVRTEEAFTRRYPAQWSSGVRVFTKGGESYYEEVIGAKGDPCNPLTDAEVESKFNVLTKPYLKPENQERIIRLVAHIEDVPDVNELTRLLVF